MRVLKKWNDTSARQAELKNVQKSPRMKRTWQKIEFSKHRNQTETETETETETDGQQTNSKTGDSLSDKTRRKKKTKRNAISRKWNNTKKTKNRKKKTLNKKPETKTIAARCKRGGREVGRVEGEGDYSLQQASSSRCVSVPQGGRAQRVQQSQREMQGKGEDLVWGRHSRKLT